MRKSVQSEPFIQFLEEDFNYFRYEKLTENFVFKNTELKADMRDLHATMNGRIEDIVVMPIGSQLSTIPDDSFRSGYTENRNFKSQIDKISISDYNNINKYPVDQGIQDDLISRVSKQTNLNPVEEKHSDQEQSKIPRNISPDYQFEEERNGPITRRQSRVDSHID